MSLSRKRKTHCSRKFGTTVARLQEEKKHDPAASGTLTNFVTNLDPEARRMRK